jgi:hypothetical protein
MRDQMLWMVNAWACRTEVTVASEPDVVGGGSPEGSMLVMVGKTST